MAEELKEEDVCVREQERIKREKEESEKKE